MRRLRSTLLLAMLAALAVLVGAATAADEPDSPAEPPGSIQFVGKNLFATANGVFESWRITGSHVDLANLEASFVEVEVDVASLNTGIERRDDHLRTDDFFDVENFPTATARLHSAAPSGIDDVGRAEYGVTVDLTMRGITHSVLGTFTVIWEAPLKVEGTMTIDRTQWGIGKPDQRFNPMAVRNEIPISFRATLGE